MTCLSKLPLGRHGFIEKIELSPDLRFRLNELGMIRGTFVKLMHAQKNETFAVFVRGTTIALRKEDVENIFVTEA